MASSWDLDLKTLRFLPAQKAPVLGLLVQERPRAARVLETFGSLAASRFLSHLHCHHVAGPSLAASATPGPAAPFPSVRGPMQACVLCLHWQDSPSSPPGKTRSSAPRNSWKTGGEGGVHKPSALPPSEAPPLALSRISCHLINRGISFFQFTDCGL